MYNGFLNVDKPAGMTSHDVVAIIRRIAGQKRVGHGGTLDPLATGVLPIALGGATRLVEYLVEGVKAYQATIRLGITTTTDDAEGEEVSRQPAPDFTHDELYAALQAFIGEIQQAPPQYSAVQVGGQRMYALARQGLAPQLDPRPVFIERIDVIDWRHPDLEVKVVCGKGTYIRALARDLGAVLGCGAHLVALRRTQVGPLDLETAVSLEELRNDPQTLQGRLLPPAAAVADWPMVVVDAATVARLRNGLPSSLPLPPGLRGRVHSDDGSLVALVALQDEQWRPFKVLIHE